MQYVSVDELVANGCLIGSCIQNNESTHCYPLYSKSTRSPCQPIVCQTPWVLLPVRPRYIARRNKRVHFINVSFVSATDNRRWLRFLNGFQEVLQALLQRNETVDTYTWMSMLEAPSTYAFLSHPNNAHRPAQRHATWKITTVLSKSLRCFDIHQQTVPLDDFLTNNTHRHIRLIVRFSHVWVNTHSQTAGVAVDILQMQQHETQPIQEFAFATTNRPSHTVSTQTDVQTQHASTDHNTTSPPPAAYDNRCDHPVYGTYFKMLAKRVPKPAVQHKMRMNGLDPDILDWEATKPLPHAKSSMPVDQLSMSLQDDRQLRKTETNTHDNKPRDGAGHGFSLDEIVSGLNSLRKTFMGGKKNHDGAPTIDVQLAQQKTNSQSVVVKKKTSGSSFMKLLGATFG